ncbi:MAG TPA: hypothetical protein VLB00_12005 [Gemmatimonadales bacterium]|nr:hypothetical protein [Gemmatimonadales bacterium]
MKLSTLSLVVVAGCAAPIAAISARRLEGYVPAMKTKGWIAVDAEGVFPGRAVRNTPPAP